MTRRDASSSSDERRETREYRTLSINAELAPLDLPSLNEGRARVGWLACHVFMHFACRLYKAQTHSHIEAPISGAAAKGLDPEGWMKS